MEKLLTISQVAEQVHVSPQTLRNYERIGLFKPELVLESGHRRYTQRQIDDFLNTMKP